MVRRTFLLPILVLPALALAQGAKEAGGIVIEVRHDSRPVAAANVGIDDGSRKQDALIDPAAKGDAAFSGVKPGNLKVIVRYRAKGKDAAPVRQEFRVAPGGSGVQHFTVALPEAAETLGGAGGTVAGGSALPPPVAVAPRAKEGDGFNGVGALFALLVGAGVAGGAWYLLRKNPEMVGGTLEKLGAQIPKPGDAPLADPPVAPAPAPEPPAPPQKIVLDDAPAPVSVGSGPIALATALADPVLVSSSGARIPLEAGETIVGREVGLGLSLAGETTVSRRHAVLERQGETLTLRDEGSTNGTFVNGGRLQGSTPLGAGDVVRFGAVEFRVEG